MLAFISWSVVACFLLGTPLFASPAAKPTTSESKPIPRLSPLLPSNHLAGTKNEWLTRRETLLRQWREVLGPLPANRPPLNVVNLGSEVLPDFTREHIQYDIEKGVTTDGYLLTPKTTEKRLPGLVVFHATTGFGARGPAGLAPEYPKEKWHGVQFVRQGYVVWCPRNYINTDGTDYAGNAKRLLKAHPEWTGMTRMTWDAIRAMDFMRTRERVDPNRIGCFGHSLGAKEVLYSMAFDDRYRAGVFSEGGIGLRFSNWDAPWYLGAKIREPGFAREHHELLGLIAPRPFLLLAGDSADDERSKIFIDAARPVYALYGSQNDLHFVDHHLGHVYNGEARDQAERFFAKYLK